MAPRLQCIGFLTCVYPVIALVSAIQNGGKMGRFMLLATSLVMVMLTGCGKSVATCSTPDVLETLRDASVERIGDPPREKHYRDNLKIDGIVTLDVDKDVGAYQCKANFSYTDSTGKEHRQEIGYNVHQVESEDASFEVSYDSMLGSMALAAILAERQQAAFEAAKKQEAERVEAEAAFARDNPPIPLTEEEAVREIESRVASVCGSEQCGQVSSFGSDLNGDGLQDYAVLFSHKTVVVPYGEPEARREVVEYKLGCAYQGVSGPAKKNGLGFVSYLTDLPTLPEGIEPIGVAVNGTRIEVNSEDGDVVYSCENGSQPREVQG